MAALDINDVYAFRSPADNNNLVVILSVHPYRGATPDPLFATDGKYEIYVSNSPDGAPDETPEATVKVTFSGSPQQFRVSGLGADITGAVGQTVSAAGIKVYCGPRDDPFFFDLDGFRHFVSGPYIPAAGYRDAAMGAPVNFFGGANIGAIVIELPITSLMTCCGSSGAPRASTSSRSSGASPSFNRCQLVITIICWPRVLST